MNAFQVRVELVPVVVTDSVCALRSAGLQRKVISLCTPSHRARGQVLGSAGDLLFEAVALAVEVF